MSSLPDARYDALVDALRAARPAAGDGLRARVAALGEVAAADARSRPAARRRWTPPWRTALLAAPIVVAFAAVGLALDGRPSGGDGADAESAASGTVRTFVGRERSPRQGPAEANWDVAPAPNAYDYSERNALGSVNGAGATGGRAPSAIPPSGRRLQDYRAELRVRVGSVGALSEQTTEAMRIARSLGGFVVNAQFAQPGDGDGDSRLVVRVPVDKVSQAVMRFSALGTVDGQQVAIQDLQGQYNRQTERIERLRETIAGFELELLRTDLSDDARIRLRERVAATRAQLKTALGGRQATERRGRLATVSLTLTTREGAELQPPAPPGRFEDTLRDAVRVLATLLTWLLAALIVAGPFALLLVAAALLERRRRRRADERLLETTA